MKSFICASAVALALAVSGPALAGGKSACAPGNNQDALIDFYTNDEPTGSPTPGGTISSLGGALAGGFYGNSSNAGIDVDAPANGHGVTPSISPGPQINGGGGPGTGTSIGDTIKFFCP